MRHQLSYTDTCVLKFMKMIYSLPYKLLFMAFQNLILNRKYFYRLNFLKAPTFAEKKEGLK